MSWGHSNDVITVIRPVLSFIFFTTKIKVKHFKFDFKLGSVSCSGGLITEPY